MTMVSNAIRHHKLFIAGISLVLFLSLIRIPLGTFNDNSTIDSISHFVLPALLSPFMFNLLSYLANLPAISGKSRIIMTALIGIAGSVLWEVFEFGVDAWFGTHWQIDNADTMHDLMFGLIGAPAGSWLYSWLYDRHSSRLAASSSDSAED